MANSANILSTSLGCWSIALHHVEIRARSYSLLATTVGFTIVRWRLDLD